jgi:hypothetical protein
MEVPTRRTVSDVFRTAGRWLPRGWRVVAVQTAIWFGFLLCFQLARGLVDHDRAVALANGRRIVEVERHLSRPLVELTLQRLADSSAWLRTAAAWTYWNSEFTVVLAALVWVYLRRHGHFARLRNSLVLAGLLARVGFGLRPTAPPRMFPRLGFRDTLAMSSGVNHGSGLVQLASNPYAAMRSLHSADALVVALLVAASCRHRWSKAAWLLWPPGCGFASWRPRATSSSTSSPASRSRRSRSPSSRQASGGGRASRASAVRDGPRRARAGLRR